MKESVSGVWPEGAPRYHGGSGEPPLGESRNFTVKKTSGEAGVGSQIPKGFWEPQ